MVVHCDMILSFSGHIQGVIVTHIAVMVSVHDITEVQCVQKLRIVKMSEFGIKMNNG